MIKQTLTPLERVTKRILPALGETKFSEEPLLVECYGRQGGEDGFLFYVHDGHSIYRGEMVYLVIEKQRDEDNPPIVRSCVLGQGDVFYSGARISLKLLPDEALALGKALVEQATNPSSRPSHLRGEDDQIAPVNRSKTEEA